MQSKTYRKYVEQSLKKCFMHYTVHGATLHKSTDGFPPFVRINSKLHKSLTKLLVQIKSEH